MTVRLNNKQIPLVLLIDDASGSPDARFFFYIYDISSIVFYFFFLIIFLYNTISKYVNNQIIG